jgi:hypothetical protein
MKIILPRKIQEHLDGVLEVDERVIDVVKEPWSYTKWHRWTILTNIRIILIIRWPFGLSHDVWPLYLRALSIDMNEGVIFDTIYLDYFGQKFKLQFFEKHRKETLKFFQEVNRQFMLFNPTVEKEKNVGIVNEMDTLSKIFYHKMITREEYERRKRELIDKS